MDKFISMWKVRELADKVTNVVMNYTEIEGKVREATNDEPWGPTGPLMQELAHATFTYEHFPEAMSMLWKRMLQDNKTNWRRTYKSLLLLNYLVRNGSERVVTSSREHIYDLRSLENYTFVDENGKDQGINVRHKVRELIDFIQDDDKLREERKKAKKNKDKYIGMSSEAMGGLRYGGGSSEYGAGYRDNWDSRRNEDRGYNENKDRYEYDYQYDGEREDSDTESNGPHANRYYDKERSKSPAARQSSTLSVSSGAGVSTTTAIAGEKKINLNIKSSSAAPVAPAKAPITVAPTKGTKKIDMGAASNYGKVSDLGINSPTHRNTHAEEILATPDSSGKQNNEILEDLFKTCPGPPSEGTPSKVDELDDFDPRSEDTAKPATAGQEFGDFESAFGKGSKPTKAGDDFADFTAFSSVPAATATAAPPAAIPSNDLFFGLNPSATSAVPPASAATASGLNLFGMPEQQQSKQKLATNDLLSDLSGLTLGSTNVPAEGAIKGGNAGRHLAHNYRALMELLQSVPKIRSKDELVAIGERLDDLLECLPGPRTPQRLMMIDDGNLQTDQLWVKFAADDYPDLLSELVERFDIQFPGGDSEMDEKIWRLFSMDYNSDYVGASLQILTDSRKLAGNREAFARILDRLIRDEQYLVGCFVELSLKDASERGENKVLAEQNQRGISEKMVQILTAIPNKMANVFHRETPEIFLPENFFRLLVQQLLKAVNCITRIAQLHDSVLSWETSFLSMFLSKLISDFTIDKRSTHLQTTLRILSAWAQINTYQCKPLITSIFASLSRSAVETTALIALREGIDLNDLLTEENRLTGVWRYVLTQKIPLYSSFSEDAIGENLIYLLARHSDHERETSLLGELTHELLTVWSSLTSIQRTSFEQHLYISKLLLLSMAYSYRFKVRKWKPDEIRDFRSLLFGGLRCHLESPVCEMRSVGMIVSEVILGYFDEKDVEEENKLKFEYQGLGEDILKMVEHLRTIGSRSKFNDDDLSQDGIDHGEENLDQLVETLFMNQAQATKVTQSKQAPPAQEKIVNLDHLIRNEAVGEHTEDSDDSELDSDDDLEPYDMSNDTKIEREKFRPKYLLDLREVLIDSSDQHAPERFEYSIQAAPELIEQQLSNNDVKLALELLQLFLTLESRCYMENFQELKFSSLVAICSTYPQQCADYLCREFHSDLSKYSLNRRILMLDILAQTAKNLSNRDPNKHIPPPSPPQVSTTDTSRFAKNTLELKFREENELRGKRQLAERIVRERIESKTRRFSIRPAIGRPEESVNRFADVAGWFFFPLLRGFGSKQFLFSANLKFQYDADSLLLTTFLQTLSVLMICAENCPIARKFARELLNLSLMMRFSEEPKVRLSVLQLLASILMAVGKDTLRQDFYTDLVEIKRWLEECVQSSIVRSEPNEECRELARHVLVMCYNVLSED
ncbi:telomere length regulation protein TEL2 homolog [Toxorhynchites rutilus septentrionalis]|uniref:telomere length regulation protein TEL2 homolog n=1 Tax=Toxorhynchites rutilus septentrionalis TaxID=329112 RepID=UPI002479EA91|nr:telomere length regulation protein TEL2 homolog [Toxorhynchites rutilus septentrionalis]